ncbi:MAG: LarC family nickel insertion protein, partial [Anaerolineae bacterium]
PLPAPATLELLKGLPIEGRPEPGETVTPTGAALLAALVTQWGAIPPMRLSAIGYGAGGRDTATPNLVRLLLGEPGTQSARSSETIVRLSTDVDDMTPEALGYAQQVLLRAGALDVAFQPLFMKKNRPATRVEVLCLPQDASALETLLFVHTSTLGVRVEHVQRHTVGREIQSVHTPWGTVRLKIATLPDGSRRAAPEYEDCRRLAQQHHLPLRRVYQAAIQTWETEQQ